MSISMVEKHGHGGKMEKEERKLTKKDFRFPEAVAICREGNEDIEICDACDVEIGYCDICGIYFNANSDVACGRSKGHICADCWAKLPEE